MSCSYDIFLFLQYTVLYNILNLYSCVSGRHPSLQENPSTRKCDRLILWLHICMYFALAFCNLYKVLI